MGIAFRDRAIERFPVAQAQILERRLEQIIRLLAHHAALRFRTDRARTHQDRDDGRRAAHALRQQPPDRPLAILVVGHAQIELARDIRRDDRALRVLRHHVDGQVVHHAAIDQQMAVMGHGRKNARQRHARAQGAPHRAGAMHMDAARGEIGRHAEKRLGNFLDAAFAEILAQ
jgi:hypothetical protein